MQDSTIFNLAILKAKVGQREQLKDALLALVPLTRQETGCLDYTLFELVDTPGTFYMRESFRSPAALEAHFATPYFQAFAKRADELLDSPLQLVALAKISQETV